MIEAGTAAAGFVVGCLPRSAKALDSLHPHKASFDAAFGDDVDAALEALEENVDTDVGVFEPQPGGDGRLVFMPSGLGDGGGPVLKLLSDGQCVGIEHEFIDSSQPY